ncbi:ubiquitin carboxyl-terminal hydrolase-domain-containing protein [Limtongia smithiae]|uniref:ubiquitin carboxyl-terminal hydrolase-domain-containing protein n=1 Tax=Limtongia smithiae TaxID=1125753 RepID=UPI0034CDFE3B
MESWHEIFQAATQPFGNPAAPITALTFDTSQELIWTGDLNGRVASFAGPSLRKYTSYMGHSTAVNQILINDRGVLSLGSSGLRMTQRRGILRFNLSDDKKYSDLTCMSYTSRGTSEVVVGGRSPGLLRVNVDRGATVGEVSSETGFTIMCHGGRLICAGATSGEVALIDPVSLQVVRKIPAHSTNLTDLDARDNVLLTCGHTYRGSSYLLDPLLNIYDLRTFRAQPPVPFPAGAAHVRLHPKLSTVCLISSATGQLQMLDFVNMDMTFLYQANIPYVSTLEFSSSGEYFALASNAGVVHIWGTPDSTQFTEYSRPTEYADAVMDGGPPVNIDDDSTSLSTVGMPYYRDKLLSAWPGDMVFNAAKPAEPIAPDILASMKPVAFGAYAIFPKRLKRYVTEALPYQNASRADSKTPMFRSEQDKLSQQQGVALVSEGATTDPVEAFKKVEMKYSKFGVEDFDFGFYNRTPYAGLETHLQNSYTNALLQLLRFTPPIYNFALDHVSRTCEQQTCLLCELGFLFDMLAKANGQHCRAYNFVHVLSSIPQATALRLIDDETASTQQPVGVRTQAFNRFLLEKIAQESRSSEIRSSDYLESIVAQLDTVAGVGSISTVSCSVCKSESTRRVTHYVTDLQYPKLASGSTSAASAISFCSILQQSLETTNMHTRGWCSEKCRRYQTVSTTKRVQSLPPVLIINIATDFQTRHFWNQKNFLPVVFRASAGAQGGVKLDTIDETLAAAGAPGMYELVGVVVEVNFGPTDNHMVSLIRIPQPDGSRGWYLFNDFFVTPFSAAESLKFDYAWKTPTALVYQTCDPTKQRYSTEWVAKMDTTLLYRDLFMNFDRQGLRFEYECLAKEEAPEPGMLVAIDAEFVQLQQEESTIRSDGTRMLVRPSRLSLARVSVVRGEGPKAGIAFIDDYISTSEEIVDYLTEFSGIEIGDLDPAKSKKPLVALKVAYKKLWLLLNLGVVFVGHGLTNDFRTINIQVPKDQVIDTLDIYYIKSRHRKLSLRFLSWYLLQSNIQTENHDSIEDARAALYLYNKYREINTQGGPSAFENILNEIYTDGRLVNFRPPPQPQGAASLTKSPPLPGTTAVTITNPVTGVEVLGTVASAATTGDGKDGPEVLQF